MGDLLDDDDFGDFVVVAPAPSADPPVGRTDSFSFGGPVKSETASANPAPLVTPAADRAPPPLSPSPISEMMLSMHGVRTSDPAPSSGAAGSLFTKLSGALPDIFGLDSPTASATPSAHFSFTQATLDSFAQGGKTPSEPSSFHSIAVQKSAPIRDNTQSAFVQSRTRIQESTPVQKGISIRKSTPVQNSTPVQAPPVAADDWGDFASPQLREASPKAPQAAIDKPSKAAAKPKPLSSIRVAPLANLGSASTYSATRSAGSLGSLDPKPLSPKPRSPRPLNFVKSSTPSPQSSPKRSSPQTRRTSLESGTSSPRSSNLRRPSSKPAAKPSTRSKPAPQKDVVLIGNLMPPGGVRAFRERVAGQSQQDVNQARFAMAAGLASEWASDFQDDEVASEPKAVPPPVQAPVPMADLMDWGEDDVAETGLPTAGASPPDNDFGDDFGDFVSATSSASTSRRASDLDFLSSVEPPSDSETKPNGLPGSTSHGSIDGLGFPSDGAAKKASASTGVGVVEGFGEELVQPTSPLDAFFAADGPQKTAEKSFLDRTAESLPSKESFPLMVDFESAPVAVKPANGALTPQSTLHAVAPPLFPDSDTPDNLSELPSASGKNAIGGTPVLEVGETSIAASEFGSEASRRSSVAGPAFGVAELGRLPSLFGGEFDDKDDPYSGAPSGVTKSASANTAPSLEALLSSTEYQASISKAWGGSTGPGDGAFSNASAERSTGLLEEAASMVPPTHSSAASTLPEFGQAGRDVDVRHGEEASPALGSFGSFSFGPAADFADVSPSGGEEALKENTQNGSVSVTEGAIQEEDDDEFGDFESASAPETSTTAPSGGAALGDSLVGAGEPSTSDGVTHGSARLEDALFGAFGAQGGSDADLGGSSFSGGVMNSAEIDLFGGFDAGPKTSSAASAAQQENDFGGFEGPRRSSVAASTASDFFGGFEASTASSVVSVSQRESGFGGSEGSRRNSAIAASEVDDFFSGFQGSRRQSTVTAATLEDDLFGAFETSGRNGEVASTAQEDGVFGSVEGSRKSSAAPVDPFGGLQGFSRSPPPNGLGPSGGLGGFESLGFSRASSGSQAGGLDMDFLSGFSNSNSGVKNDVVKQQFQSPGGDPFLDLMGMGAPAPSNSNGALEEPIEVTVQGLEDLAAGLSTASEPRRSFSARRQRREQSRRGSWQGSESASEEGSVRNRGSHSRRASWQEADPQRLERTSGSLGSGRRKSYKESDLLEVGMQLLEEGRVAEACACAAHIEAQRKLPEKKVQYERAMVESPMKAFDIMKEIQELEASLASAHVVSKWQKPSIGSRRGSISSRPETLGNGSAAKQAQSDISVEGQRAFVKAWEDLAHACADELEEGQEIWQQAVEGGCDQELLHNPKGRQYFSSLCRVYFVAALLSCLTRWRKHWLVAAGDAAEGLESCLSDCWRTAEGDLRSALSAVSGKGLGFSDVWKSAQCAVLEAAVRKGPGQRVCGLTLVPEGAVKGIPLVAWQGRTFLAPVANLWANRIPGAVPHLTIP